MPLTCTPLTGIGWPEQRFTEVQLRQVYIILVLIVTPVQNANRTWIPESVLIERCPTNFLTLHPSRSQYRGYSTLLLPCPPTSLYLPSPNLSVRSGKPHKCFQRNVWMLVVVILSSLSMRAFQNFSFFLRVRANAFLRSGREHGLGLLTVGARPQRRRETHKNDSSSRNIGVALTHEHG